MGTTAIQDNQAFVTATTTFEVSTRSAANGTLVYAGNLWPIGVVDTNAVGATPAARQMRREIDEAFADARAMVTAGFLKAAAGVKNDEAAGLLMKKWFGDRQTGVGQNDWWRGAYHILGRLQAQLAQNINVFYRGDDSLIGKPTDYPGEHGNLTASDVRGYAETGAGAGDGNIGLCKAFFARESGGVFKTAKTGRDSVGGCLAHELSHNYCETDDHEAANGGTCYGEAKCLKLAKDRRRRAWYNADNIEYFCEDAYWGVVASKAAINSGAINVVSNLRLAHQGLQNALKPVVAAKMPLPGGPKPMVGSGGTSIALLKAQLQANAVAQNPSLPPSG